MLVTVTGKFKMETTVSDHDILRRTMEIYRDACNFVSDHVHETHDFKKRSVHNKLYDTIRDTFSLGSQMTESVIKTVIARYQTAIENDPHTWPHCVFQKPQCDLVYNRDWSFRKDGSVSVNTLRGRIKTSIRTEGFTQYLEKKPSFGTAKLVNKRGKFFLHVPLTFDVPACTEITNVVGIDRGIRFLVTAYDSNGKTVFFSGAQVKQKRAHYKELRTGLQKVRTSSSRRRLKAIGQRENRWMQDVDHCISKALVTMYPKGTLFVLEDLTGVRKTTEKVRTKDRYVSVSWSFYDLEQKLKYKAFLYGHQVIQTDPRYTSQTCPVCGQVKKENRNKRTHTFCCTECGYRSNDDRIGAMNLRSMGMEYLAQSQAGISGL